ncbi:MAG: hypothetical protein ABL868_06790 [Sulfuriferula sp.]
MSDCCTTQQHKTDCPGCQHPSNSVSAATMRHHLHQPWQWQASESAGYYFCDQPDCSIIYFSDEGEHWQQTDLRTHVGIKHPSTDALICYCFGVHYAEAGTVTREYVIGLTKSDSCACITHNPSGRCCLKDFPR